MSSVELAPPNLTFGLKSPMNMNMNPPAIILAPPTLIPTFEIPFDVWVNSLIVWRRCIFFVRPVLIQIDYLGFFCGDAISMMFSRLRFTTKLIELSGCNYAQKLHVCMAKKKKIPKRGAVF